MSDLQNLTGKHAAVLGLGKTGLAAATALQKSGVHVSAWDDQADTREHAEKQGIKISNLTEEKNWADIDFLVLSPGIPHTYPMPHPAITLAKKLHIPITGDIDLLGQAQDRAKYIGITGTNGKSTTTALVGHILQSLLPSTQVGGNLGTPVLSFAPLGHNEFYVLELSSYQLELLPTLRFDIAALLNITPDHIDRHGSMQGYIEAKKLIFRDGGKPQTFILGIDDKYTKDIYEKLQKTSAATIVPVSCLKALENGISIQNGVLFDGDHMIMDLKTVKRLPGIHNWQNAGVAFAIAKAAGLRPADIINGILTFPGLAHRQELVAEAHGIMFVNDSKATNADATEKALAAYDNIYWILGGQAKDGGIKSLKSYFPRIKKAYLIGEAAPEFAETLGDKVPHDHCGRLDIAIAKAYKDALTADTPGVILLSPACASWDQFKNFEHRGDTFRDLTKSILRGAP